MSAKDLCEDAGVFRAPTHFFAPGDGVFHPTESALSRWGADMLNGPAVVGLAARCLENDDAATGYHPTRFTADLFKAARRVPTSVVTRQIRAGRRVRTAALSRLSVGDYVGVQADSHWTSEGIAVGSATLFDDLGRFGIGMVTAVANPAAQIDFGAAP